MINSNSKVLVVEDDEIFSSFIVSSLEAAEIDHLVTLDSTKAEELACSYEPTLIVTDLMMPNMNGMELVRNLKNNPLTAHIPVIFFSGSNRKEDVVMGLHYGIIDFIDKSITSKDFIKTVISHSAVESLRDILLPLKGKTSAILDKYVS